MSFATEIKKKTFIFIFNEKFTNLVLIYRKSSLLLEDLFEMQICFFFYNRTIFKIGFLLYRYHIIGGLKPNQQTVLKNENQLYKKKESKQFFYQEPNLDQFIRSTMNKYIIKKYSELDWF